MKTTPLHAVATNTPHIVSLNRHDLKRNLDALNHTATALLATEEVLQQQITQAMSSDENPNFFILDGLFYSIRCMANQMTEVVEQIQEKAEG